MVVDANTNTIPARGCADYKAIHSLPCGRVVSAAFHGSSPGFLPSAGVFVHAHGADGRHLALSINRILRTPSFYVL